MYNNIGPLITTTPAASGNLILGGETKPEIDKRYDEFMKNILLEDDSMISKSDIEK